MSTTITTVAQLDELPIGTRMRDKDGDIVVKFDATDYMLAGHDAAFDATELVGGYSDNEDETGFAPLTVISADRPMPGLIDAILAAFEAAEAVPTVEPIFMYDTEDGYDVNDPEDIVNAPVIVICPTHVGPTDIVEVSFGALSFNETDVEMREDGIVVSPDEDDRNRHTLAWVCSDPNCRQPFDLYDAADLVAIAWP